MSGAGVPANSGQMQNDFTARRAAAAQGSDDWMRQLADGGTTAAQTVPGANARAVSPSAGAPASSLPSTPAPADSNAPLGQRFEQYLAGVGQRAHDMVFAKPGAAGQSFADALTSGFTGIPAEIGKQFVDGLRAAKADAMPQNWQQLQSSLDAPYPGTKPLMDVANAAFAPVTGALTSLIGKPVEELTGVHRELVGNLLSLAAPGALAKVGEFAKAGGAADVIDDGVTLKPGAAKASTIPDPALQAPDKTAQKPSKPAFDLAGETTNAPGASLKITPQVRQQAADWLQGRTDNNPIQSSLLDITSDQHVNDTIASVAKMIPKGSVKPDDILRMNAYSLGLTPDEVAAALKPKLPSDELMGAAGMYMDAGGKELQGYAKAALESGAPEDQEKAVRAYGALSNLISSFTESGTDMGRGMRARQLAWSATNDATKAIKDVIENAGADNVDEIIRKVAAFDDPAKVAPFVSNLRRYGARDGLVYGWYNLLLSNPGIILKKAASDTTVAAWNVAARYAAEKMGSGAVPPGEAAALLQGYMGSMGDAIRGAGKALKAGQSQFYGDYQTTDGRVISRLHNNGPALADEAQASPTYNAIDFLKSAMPTSWIGAADDFAKIANYRAELHALAFRQGMKKGLAGDALSDHIAQALNNVSQPLHEQAVSAALKNTFQEPLTGISQNIQDIADKMNIGPVPLGRVILPFVKVPANFLKFVYQNSPLPLVPWLRSDPIRAQLAAGGASADVARARIGLGTAVSIIAATLAAAGHMTGGGPSDPRMRSAWLGAGNKPYHLTFGGQSVEYNKIEPIGTLLGTVADTADILRYAHEKDAGDAAMSLVFGTGNALLSKTYMQGLSDFLEALHNPDQNASRYLQQLVTSMTMPQGAAALDRATDPWLRAHYGFLDSIAARTPGVSHTLPAQQNLWGEPLPREHAWLPGSDDLPGGVGQGIADAVSPIGVSDGKTSPIDTWIWQHRDDFPKGDNGAALLPGRAGTTESFTRDRIDAHVQLTPQQIYRARALAGTEIKDPKTGLGTKDYLSALVSGNNPDAGAQAQWNAASPARQALMVGQIWTQARAAAKAQLIREYPDIQNSVRAQWQARSATIQQPSIGGGP